MLATDAERDDTMNDVISDHAAWTVAACDLLVDFEMFLVDRRVACPANDIDFVDFFTFVVPDDDVVA
jgi:hypothetical protein